jgi:hypothetical protein
MADAIERDVRLIEEALAKTRSHHLTNWGFAAVIVAAIALNMRPVETTWGKFQIGFIVLCSLQFLFASRAWLRVRKNGRVAKALVGADEIAEVNGWPAIKKLPEGKYQGFFRVVTKDGARGTLRVEPRRIQGLVDALHRRSPAAKFAVVNVVPSAIDAQEPAATTG